MFELVTGATLDMYEAFVSTHPKGHFMQSRLWGDVKNNWKWEGILSRDAAGKIRGAMAVLIRKVPGMPFTLMYAGRGPVCDLTDREAIADLVAGAKALAKKHHAYELKIDPDVLSSDTAFQSLMESFGFTLHDAGKNFEGIQPRYVFRNNIGGMTEEEVLASFGQKTRYNIRLAQRKGVEVRLCGTEMVPDFARIMLETGMRDGFVVRTPEYFEKMLNALGEHARLYMAFYEGKPVAGTLAILYGDKVWYLYGASSNESRNVMPNYLLQWNMIQWAIELGCRIYDFRGVSGDLSEDNPLYGLYRFKKGFNGDFCEFVGEMDLILNKPLYLFVTNAERVYRKLRRARFLKKNAGSDTSAESKKEEAAPQE